MLNNRNQVRRFTVLGEPHPLPFCQSLALLTMSTAPGVEPTWDRTNIVIAVNPMKVADLEASGYVTLHGRVRGRVVECIGEFKGLHRPGGCETCDRSLRECSAKRTSPQRSRSPPQPQTKQKKLKKHRKHRRSQQSQSSSREPRGTSPAPSQGPQGSKLVEPGQRAPTPLASELLTRSRFRCAPLPPRSYRTCTSAPLPRRAAARRHSIVCTC